jgi:hypothetical protein
VAEDGAGGPFGEFYFGFDFRAEPGVVGHFFGGHSLAPMATARRSPDGGGRQVGEGALFGDEGLEQGEEGAAVGGVEALVDFAGEEELGPAAGARPGTSQRNVPTMRVFEVADQKDVEFFAVGELLRCAKRLFPSLRKVGLALLTLFVAWASAGHVLPSYCGGLPAIAQATSSKRARKRL